VLVHGLLDTPAVFTALKRELAGRRHPLLIPALPLRLGRFLFVNHFVGSPGAFKVS
jgi:hypothetical protein